MVFKFDSLTNRISPSTATKAYNPAGLSAKEIPKDPVFMFESSKVKAASMDAVGQGAAVLKHGSGGKTLGVVPTLPGYGRITALQKKWAINDGLMVWQKKGFRDMGPYYLNLAGIAVGTAYSFYLVYKMSFPPKQ